MIANAIERPDRGARAFARGARALVCYVTAGHPGPDASVALLHGLEAAGADVIELGLPFSEPLADGPMIQASRARVRPGNEFGRC